MIIFHPLLCYYPSQAGGPANTLYWLNSELSVSDFSTQVLSTNFGLDSNVPLNEISENTSSVNHQVQFLDNKSSGFLKIGMNAVQNSDIIQFSSLFFPPTLPLLVKAII
jgi:hypothetical protein